MVGAAHGRAARHRTFGRGGRVLPFGEAVDLVVEEQHVDVHVAAQQVDQVVAADAQRIAIAGDHPHAQLGAHAAQAADDGGCAAVDAVHAVRVQVVREARGAADAADEDDLLLGAWPVHLSTRLHLLQDGVVAAAGTPAHFLVAAVIDLLRRGILPQVHGAHCFQQFKYGVTDLRAVKGMPWILFKPCASTRNSARSIWRSWPLFISGTSTLLVALQQAAAAVVEGEQVPQMHDGHAVALLLQLQRGGADGAVGGAPADDQQLAALRHRCPGG
jgi:hypothetical protein